MSFLRGVSADPAAWESIRNAIRVLPPDPLRYPGPYLNRFVPQDLRVSQEEMASLSVAWGSIRLIVDSLASLEWKTFVTEGDNKKKQIHDDQVAWMFNVRPNPDLTAQAMKEMLITQCLLDGDGYGYINYDNALRPAQVWPLDSQCMQVLRNPNTQELVYRYTHPNHGSITDLAPWEIYHLRGPSVRGLTGDSTIYRAAKAIALGVAQERYATGYYANGANPGIILKPPTGSQRKADPDLDDRLRAEWKKKHGNARSGGGSIAIGEPGWEYQVIETDAMKSQIVPARQFSTEDIARYFGVPLVLLGVQAAAQGYGTNVSQLYLVFARNTLLPWTNRLTEEAQFKFYPQRKPWKSIELDLSPLMRGDEVQRETADEIALRSGKITLNEARAKDGLNAYGPEGDVPIVSSKMQTLEHAIEAPEPPGVPAPPPEDASALPAKPPPKPGNAGRVARAAVALDRYARRMQARRADLERHSPDKVAENLAAEQARSLPGLVDDLRQAIGVTEEDACAVAQAVLDGEPVHLAAIRIAS